MRKKYYIDLVLLIIMLVVFIYLVGRIDNLIYTAILAIFLIISFYINVKFRIVLKYPYDCTSSINDNIGYFLVILGKVAYIIDVIAVTNTDSNMNHDFIIYCLFAFMLHLFVFKNTSYIYNNNLIYNFSKIIDIRDIDTYEIREKSLDTYYLLVYLKNDVILNLSLSDHNFQKFKIEIG